jgi:hypothetical protein
LGAHHPDQVSSIYTTAQEAPRGLGIWAWQWLYDLLSVARAWDDVFLGAGPVLYYPSATNKALGVNKWGSGPSAAFLKKDAGPCVWGAVVNNIWSFGGPTHSSDRIKRFLLNPFFSYHFSNGWSLASSPNITANWLSKNGQQWTVPIGGGIQKAFRLGDQRMKLSLDSYYKAIRPHAGNQTALVQVTLTLLFPLEQ